MRGHANGFGSHEPTPEAPQEAAAVKSHSSVVAQSAFERHPPADAAFLQINTSVAQLLMHDSPSIVQGSPAFRLPQLISDCAHRW
jgi:hypothetical protein